VTNIANLIQVLCWQMGELLVVMRINSAGL
jgi:hypothetical protein